LDRGLFIVYSTVKEGTMRIFLFRTAALIAAAALFFVACNTAGGGDDAATEVFVSTDGGNIIELAITSTGRSVTSRAIRPGRGSYVLKRGGEKISEGSVNIWPDSQVFFTSKGGTSWTAQISGERLTIEGFAIPMDDGTPLQVGEFAPKKKTAEILMLDIEGQWINPNGSNPSFKFKDTGYQHYRYPNTLLNKGTFARTVDANGVLINFIPENGSPSPWSQGFEIIGDDIIFIVPELPPAHNYGPFYRFDSGQSIFEGVWVKGTRELRIFGNLVSVDVPYEYDPETGIQNGGRGGARFTYIPGPGNSGVFNFELGYGVVYPVPYDLTGNTLTLRDFPSSLDFLNGTYTKQP
jgi:hypothetical protein